MADTAKEESSKPSMISMIAMFLIGSVISFRYWQVIIKRTDNQPPALRAPSEAAPATTSKRTEANQAASHTSTQPPTRLARLNVLANDGTAELQTLFLQSQITDSQRTALGLDTLAPGTDLYAVRVRIENTGTTSVRIYPGNIRMHHGNQAVSAYVIEHPAFLQLAVLEPNHFLTGLVVYRATLDVGAAIRLRGEGSYSYEDSSILVTYGSGSR